MLYRGVIYKRTCLATGEVYIGQTTNEISRKADWFNLSRSYTSKYSKVDLARKKYGPDNFDYEVICVYIKHKMELSRILNREEIKYIKYYDSFNNGLNSTKGGNAVDFKRTRKSVVMIDKGGNLLKTFKELDSAASYCLYNKYTGTNKDIKSIASCIRSSCSQYSPESKTKSSQSSYGFIWMYEKDYLDHYKDKVIILNNAKFKKIVQLNLDGSFVREWDSPLQVTKECGIDNSLIAKCCKRKEQTMTSGFLWMYYDEYKEALQKNIDLSYSPTRPIVKLDIFGNFIDKFDSLSEAAASLNDSNKIKIYSNGISTCALSYSDLIKSNLIPNNHGHNSMYGFIWIYLENYIELNYKTNLKNLLREILFPVAVVQFDINDHSKIIDYFNRPKEVKDFLGLSDSGVIRCCKGFQDSSCGYYWKYYTDLTSEQKEQIQALMIKAENRYLING